MAMARLPYTDVRDLMSSAETFAAALPVLAGALAETTTDAPLERVREGLFYLGATCIDRVRELEAEGQRALAEIVAPELLRPFPAATIALLSSEGGVRRVPAGAEVTDESGRCRFRTTTDLRLAPWQVEAARVQRPAEGPHALCFDLVATADLSLAEAIANIRPRFYVDGPDALSLVAHLVGHTARAEIVLEGSDAAVSLGEVLPFGTRADQALAPEPDGPHTGLTLLREYFLLPEKFCFFALAGLTAALRDTAVRRATVTLTFRRPLPPQVTGSPSIRAHCVPCINLFPAPAEPWIFEAGRSSAPLRVAGALREEGGIYAVFGVSAMACDGAAEPVPLSAARRFAAAPIDESFPYAYSTTLLGSPGREEPEVVLQLTSPRGRAPAVTPHVISTQLLATNRARASRLRPGDLSESGTGMPSGVRVRNLTTTSPYVPPPTRTELARQVAVRAAVPDGDALYALRSRLFAFVPRRGLDRAMVRAHVARVEALQHLEAGIALDRAGSRRGYEVRLTVDETPFSGLGDVALFVRLLSAALEAQTSIGHFVRCVATCTKSGARIAWPSEEQP
jgi:type VI secretion system protein ImpG